MQKFVDMTRVRDAIRAACAAEGLRCVAVEIADVTSSDEPRGIQVIVARNCSEDPSMEPLWQNN